MSATTDFTDIVPDAPLSAGTIVQGRYEIVRRLGRGGMGAVYEAVDRRLGITVALKETLSNEPSMRKQFEREARLLASLQHAALPRVTDHFVEGNRAFLVMQYIAGVDLARIISQQPGPFPRDQVIAWADQLLDALIYLHSHDRQVIHRDIKPHNLKLTAAGQIALLDFGLAKASSVDTSVTASRAFFGYTRQYAPLEQIEDRRTDPRSDIYALGATLYHLLTGIKPPDALVRAAAVINSEADPLQSANMIYEAVGPAVSAILAKAMALRPEQRYASASEFREALRRMGRAPAPVKTELVENRTASASGETTVFRYREIIGPQLAMVESRRRFGPGALAALMVLAILGVFVALLYNSRATDLSLPENSEAKVTAAKPPAAPRRNERDSNTNVQSLLKNQTSDRDHVAGRRVEKNAAVNMDGPPARVASKPLQPPSAPAAKQRKTIDVPALRLPNPELGNGAMSPISESRNRGFDEVKPRAYKSAPPQFFRASDGTLTVKFSDGSTRTVKPGTRAAQ
ncbi:MAG TPA: serine/threonine-protein kinase [Pyrinomonadaceae bacterium]|nr:serine/threonine-protein kinase [Pyrinomonadaceae bacterium]